MAVFYLGRRILIKMNPLPLCRNRRCSSRKYKLEKQSAEGTYYRCGCDDLYLLTLDDKFKFVREGGDAQPFRQRFSRNDFWWPAPEIFEKYRKAPQDGDE